MADVDNAPSELMLKRGKCFEKDLKAYGFLEATLRFANNNVDDVDL